MEMKDMDEPGSQAEKRGGRAKHADGGDTGHRGHHARGGKAGEKKVNVYNAEGSPTMKEAEDEEPDFKRGGRSKHKDGGLALGGAAKMRADKPARGLAAGGAARPGFAAGGRAGAHSPYSSGRKLTAPEDAKESRGYEGVSVPPEPE
jgi:hypothetical protein